MIFGKTRLSVKYLTVFSRGLKKRMSEDQGNGEAPETGNGGEKYVFRQKFNPLTGESEWDTQNEDYDYHQEVARSAYADMLHDTERNKKYFEGLKWAIAQLRAQGKPVRVLDIGTGTGLLSMMAASLGADDVTACEAFDAVSQCAKKVLAENGFADQIRLVPKISCELTVGPDGDMPHRANLLITEVFDTELIGEGAIRTYNLAHKDLLEEGCLTVPTRSTVYVQAVQSKMLSSWIRPKPLLLPGNRSIKPFPEIVNCPGAAALVDIQMSQLPEGSFTPMSEPMVVAKFDFTGKSKIRREMTETVPTMATADGQVDAFLFWWDLDMTADGEVNLSCAPWWQHEEGRKQPWRDHWMQAVYFPRKPLPVTAGRRFDVISCHDEYSFWFDARSESLGEVPKVELPQPSCICGFHLVCSAFRIGAMNETAVQDKYISVLQKLIRPDSVCAYFGSGGSWLPLVAAKLGAKKVFVFDSEPRSHGILKSFVATNDLNDVVFVNSRHIRDVKESDLDGLKADVILGEPCYMTGSLPWHDLYFSYQMEYAAVLRAADCRIVPEKATLWAIGVNFTHLWKIRAPLVSVEGFRMDPFDDMIQGAMDIADPPVEAHRLWEYEGIAVTEAFRVTDFDLNARPESRKVEGSAKLESPERCNGVALWIDWHVDPSVTVTGGPQDPVVIGGALSWTLYAKQAVFFLPPHNNAHDQIDFSLTFDSKNNDLKVFFTVK